MLTAYGGFWVAYVMAATPEVMALRDVGLVQLVASEQGKAKFALTTEGNAVLRVLGAG